MPEPDVNELSCDPCTACGHPKALHRSNCGACFAERNGNRPSHSAIEDIERRKKFGVECWCRNYESNLTAGTEAVLKYADRMGLVAAANAALERGDFNSSERLFDCYIRKTPEGERDTDWINATARSISRSRPQDSGLHIASRSLNKSIIADVNRQKDGLNVSILGDAGQDSAIQELFEKDEGPGSVGVEWFHTKEYLRDLWKDDLLPSTEKQTLRDYYTHQENVLHAKLVFFAKKESVERRNQALRTTKRPEDESAQHGQVSRRPAIPEQDRFPSAEGKYSEAKEALAKAQVELRAAASHLSRLCQDSKTSDSLEATARKWRLTREWEAITPDELKPAVEALRHAVEHHGFWQSIWSTDKLCHAALHPADPSLKDSKTLDDLTSYRRFLIALLGPQIERKLLNSRQPVPAIFNAYRDVLEAALKLLTKRGFRLMLGLAEANSTLLNVHPIEWAKRQLEILISAKKSAIRSWIMDACDPPILSVTASTDDSIFGGKWRAPRFIYMSPAGNGPYDREAAWSREDLVKSQEILEAWADRITTFLSIELDEIAGEAHVRSAMRNDRRAPVEQKGPKVEPFSTPVPVPAAANLEPNFWRSLHQSFKMLSDEELALLIGSGRDRRLRAYGDYEHGKNCGQWSLSEGISEGLRGRFEVEATRAGLGLTPISGEEPITVWLHQVFQDLLANRSKLLFAASKEGGIIIRACEASAIYCARLEKQALLEATKGTQQPETPTEVQPTSHLATESGIESPPVQQPASNGRSQIQQQKIREAAIRKVQNPQSCTTVTVNEAAIYFEVRPKTIYRWLYEANLRRGGRRGSITTESIRRWEKKRSRKPRSENRDSR